MLKIRKTLMQINFILQPPHMFVFRGSRSVYCPSEQQALLLPIMRHSRGTSEIFD